MSLKSTPKNKNLIYDVGMHRGQDTDFYLKKGYEVIAFEANPDNADFGRNRFSKEIEEGRLIIVEGAITEHLSINGNPSKVDFFYNVNHSLWGSVCEDWVYRNEVMGTSHEIIQVNSTDFGHCLEKYGIPFYLKADIVGMEMVCLRALQQFENKPDYLSIRSEKVIFAKLLEELELLERLGYDKFKAIQQDFSKLKIPLKLKNGEKFEYNFEEGASGPFAEESRGNWQNKAQVLKSYEKIFVLYWLFGDFSYLNQTVRGKKFTERLERLLRRPLPGWYDTHVKHSSLKS